jgi:hypothetical protein
MRSLIAIILLTALVACTKKHGDKQAAPAPAIPVDTTPVQAQRGQAGLLDVKAELRDDGFLLHVGNVPAGATLECDLDAKPLVPCHDGALFARPADGDHVVHAVAVKGGDKLAFGDSPTFTVAPGANADEETANPLALSLADKDFHNGQTWALSKDFVARFAVPKVDGCNVELKCSYDSRTSPFWTSCDASGDSFTINKELLASGLQYLSAQASCGDRLGPILTIFFYGVPDDYQPLMLRDAKDSQGRHILNPIKADDCPPSQQVFECSENAQDPFVKCLGGNVVDAPGDGYRVRLVCDGRIGPAITLQ